MIQINIKLTLVGFVLLLFNSCKEEQIQNETLIELPTHFPETIYNNTQNPLSKEGIELGRSLFYDKSLSQTGKISCGSCHSQVHAFADHNSSVSLGIYNRLGIRNSPSIVNVAWQPNFMWDGGINHLDIMPIAPFTDKNEMGISLQDLIQKVRNSKQYITLIKKAFHTDLITEKEILYALSQFMLTLVSANSKYDQVKIGKSKFSEIEASGYQLFIKNCSQCHTEPLFTNYDYAYNGAAISKNDSGRMRITQKEIDRHKFKVPTLRNVVLTYPYMHDGSYKSLLQVIDHYNDINFSDTKIDSRIHRYAFTENEKNQIIAFLNTLTDIQYISNYKFSEP